jgi:hypothetical protein
LDGLVWRGRPEFGSVAPFGWLADADPVRACSKNTPDGQRKLSSSIHPKTSVVTRKLHKPVTLEVVVVESSDSKFSLHKPVNLVLSV